MCEWGDSVNVEVVVPARLSHTGESRRKIVPVDRCIAPIVEALVKARIVTTGSCCGHGKTHGTIGLEDGREIQIHRRPKGGSENEQRRIRVSAGAVAEASDRLSGERGEAVR